MVFSVCLFDVMLKVILVGWIFSVKLMLYLLNMFRIGVKWWLKLVKLVF